MRRTDTATEQRVIALYREGEKVDYIAACFNTTRRTIIDILRRHHVPKRKRLTMLKYSQRIREMIARGFSAREMARELGVSVRTVYSLVILTGARRPDLPNGEAPQA